jgi:hypothetical protein
MQPQSSEFVDLEQIEHAMDSFGKDGPFDHCLIDDFFLPEVALTLEREIPDFEDAVWHEYSNPIEIKKACNNWNRFPSLSYRAFSFLNSDHFLEVLSRKLLQNTALFADPGLNGGGWHIHRSGGKLNTHLDYSIHPKLGLQRKLNIIIYLNSAWKDEWGGHLGLWGNSSPTEPGPLHKSVAPRFNRAVIFDTTQNSWHGLPTPLSCPEDQFRKSMAVYYLCKAPVNADPRGKALFAPTEEQKGDAEILQLIKRRSSVKTASSVYT